MAGVSKIGDGYGRCLAALGLSQRTDEIVSS
jgi:hypothetical protein